MGGVGRFVPPTPLLAVLALPVALIPAGIRAIEQYERWLQGHPNRLFPDALLHHSSHWRSKAGSSASQEVLTWRAAVGWGWTAVVPPPLAAAACPNTPGRMSAASPPLTGSPSTASHLTQAGRGPAAAACAARRAVAAATSGQADSGRGGLDCRAKVRPRRRAPRLQARCLAREGRNGGRQPGAW